MFFKPLACNFNKKETLPQVFSCEFWEIFKNTIFYRKAPVAGSDICIYEENTGLYDQH